VGSKALKQGDKKMKTRKIQYGNEYMVLHENGEIERPGIVKPSQDWKIVGAVEYDNVHNKVKFYSLEEILKNPDKIPWKFANGKQRVFIHDIDHGTRREWQSPSYMVF
jgi:hypothetical protein